MSYAPGSLLGVYDTSVRAWTPHLRLLAGQDQIENVVVESGGERARRSAISFSPDQKGLVIAEPRETEPAGPRALAPA